MLSTINELQGKVAEVNPYELQLSTVGGRVLNRAVSSITAYVHLFREGTEVTSLFDDSCFVWTRESSDGSGDQYWNEQHSSGSKSITITRDDVLYGASFNCNFIINDEVMASI